MVDQPKPRSTYNAYLNVQEDMNFSLRKILLRAASEIGPEILKITGAGVGALIEREQKQAVKKALHERLSDLYKQAGYVVQASKQDAAAASAAAFGDYERILLSQKMSEADVATYLKAAQETARAGINNVMRRIMGQSYHPLSYNVYKTEALSRGMVDRYVETALAKNLTAKQFAKGVQSMINPNVRGGVSYAASRLARSEINNAFHSQSTYQYSQSPYVTGVNWNLSNSHHGDDDCNELAQASPYDKKKVPKKPHPQCFCYITPEMMSEDDALKAMGFDPAAGQPSIDSSFIKRADDAKPIPRLEIQPGFSTPLSWQALGMEDQYAMHKYPKPMEDAINKYVLDDKWALRQNNALRSGKNPTSDIAANLDAAIDQYHFVDNYEVWRGVALPPSDAQKMFTIGNSVDFKGWTSVTEDKGTADFYADTRKNALGGDVETYTMRLIPKIGTGAALASGEIIMERGTTWKVIREANKVITLVQE